MTVHIPSPLRSYTEGARQVQAEAGRVDELLAVLERHYPGLRFRIIDEQDGIRTHIKLFVNTQQIRALDTPLRPSDTFHIICALSGG